MHETIIFEINHNKLVLNFLDLCFRTGSLSSDNILGEMMLILILSKLVTILHILNTIYFILRFLDCVDRRFP